MTVVNGVVIPAVPGSCYHAILCAMAEQRDKFCPWQRLIDRSQFYLRKYGGYDVWCQYVKKSGVKPFEKRIRENVHTLTRSGKHCYGYRLHEQGMCVYMFRDGICLFTGGDFEKKRGTGYSLHFTDGKTIQKRYKGLSLTRSEYRYLLSEHVIDISCTLLPEKNIKDLKDKLKEMEAARSEMGERQVIHASTSASAPFSPEMLSRMRQVLACAR